MNKNLINLIVVGGPTASGKTELAIQIAQKLGGEIINADSVQVYKYMNIGSNKGNIKYLNSLNIDGYEVFEYELENSKTNGVLFDLIEPDCDFNISVYKTYADKSINYFYNSNKIPILTGGSGLYIDSIIKGYDFQSVEQNNSLREVLNELSIEELVERLKNLSIDSYQNLNNSDKNNPRRLIRLIEKNQLNINSRNNDPKYNYLFFYPEFYKDDLFNKIDKRVDWMFQNGFVEEVKFLIEKGYSLQNKALQSTGYKEIYQMLFENKYSYDECIEKVKNSHKKYAKRQITWFEGKGRNYNLIKTNSNNLLSVLRKSHLM